MASAAGRGAQVRLRGTHQAAARGSSGSRLIDNILAKRREEEEGRGSDGLTLDGSTSSGTAALDEVLTPAGLLAGVVIEEPPGGPDQLAGSTSLSLGISAGPLTAVQPQAGGLQGFTSVNTTLSGTLRGTAFLNGSTALSVRLVPGQAQARGNLASATAAIGTAAYAGPASAGGPMQGTTGLSMRLGQGLFGSTGMLTGLSGGSLRGTGALTAAAPWVVSSVDPLAQANSTVAQANSTSLQANASNVSVEPVISTALQSGTLRGIGALSGSAALSLGISGGVLSGVGTPGLSENTLTDRSGNAFALRDGQVVEIRAVLATALTLRDGSSIVLRDGSEVELRQPAVVDEIVGRDGVPIILRDGNAFSLRTMPDELPMTPPDTEDPDADVFPATPHLRIASLNSAALINAQNGAVATVRLVRPLYAATPYFSLDVFGSEAAIVDMYTSFNYDGLFIRNGAGDFELGRAATSADDGSSYSVDYFAVLSDGATLALKFNISIAADATDPNPQPTPPPADPTFFEPFDFGRGVGALTQTWGQNRFIFNGTGTVTINGSDVVQNPDGGTSIPGAGMMTPNNHGINDGVLGLPNGRYEFVVRATGPGLGDGSGPAALLWPADDVWPGSEVDLFERLADGRSYAALHRRNPDGGGDDYQSFIFQDNPALAAFDASQFNTVAADLFTSVFRFWVNGVLLAEITDPAWLPKDFLHGGVNHTVGLQNGSTNTSLECDRITFIPEASAPPVYDPADEAQMNGETITLGGDALLMR